MKRLLAVLLFCLSFSQLANAATAWYQPTPYPTQTQLGVHVVSGWVNNSYNTTLVGDDKMEIGGWGDVYRSYFNPDLTGLPKDPTNVALWFHFYPSGVSVTPFQFCIPNSTWGTTLTWSTQPSFLGCSGMLTAPSTDSWAGWTITSWYQNWQNGTWGKYGLMLNPQYNNNNFDFIRSSQYASDGYRPILQFDFTPTLELKMPLPGNHSWLVTTEVGGYDCKGDYDQYHDDVPNSQGVMQYNYFSVDFSWRNIPDSGATVYVETSNIPVVAAGGGTVATFPNDPNNGNYIVVTHGSTGFTTRYLHLKSISVSNGATVAQGDTLGYMGNTGISNGTHLHFGVRYNNSGTKTSPDLAKVMMDGWLLKSFQSECLNNDWIRYYRSGNTVY